jgi:hypothetical protein
MMTSPCCKKLILFEEIMMHSISRDVVRIPALLWKTNTLASLFPQKKILIFFGRNNDAIDFFLKK